MIFQLDKQIPDMAVEPFAFGIIGPRFIEVVRLLVFNLGPEGVGPSI